MKKILIYCTLFVTGLFFGTISVFAGTVDDIFNNDTRDTPYHDVCAEGESCLEKGIHEAKDGIGDALETDRSLSEWIQDVVVYLLGFVTLIAVVYIIYAGFQLMFSSGDEEKTKKTKNIIIYVALGIILMWLSYPITNFILDLITAEN